MNNKKSVCTASHWDASDRWRSFQFRAPLSAVLALLASSALAHSLLLQRTHLQRTHLQASESSTVPMTGSVVTRAQSTPDFRLLGTDGKSHTLRQYQGRSVALFFFCGCPWCHRCATLWGQFQRSGALSSPKMRSLSRSEQGFSIPLSSSHPLISSDLPSLTLIVFSGDSASARAFAEQTGLDPKQTVLLPDPDMHVTTLYKVDPCPRVFTLNPQGGVSYTNNHKDDAPQEAPELVMASRALDALRKAAPANRPAPK